MGSRYADVPAKFMMECLTELTRRRLLDGFVTVGSVGPVVGAETMTLFAESESSAGYVIQTGMLDLERRGVNQFSTFLDARHIDPGHSGQVSDRPGRAEEISNPPVVTSDLTASENGNHGERNPQNDPFVGSEIENCNEKHPVTGRVPPRLTTEQEIIIEDAVSASPTIKRGGSDSYGVKWRLPKKTSDVVQSGRFSFDQSYRFEPEGV